VAQVEMGMQTDAEVKELEKVIERKKERKEKERAKDSEDVVMKNGSPPPNLIRGMYEDLSGYVDEEATLVVSPPVTKKRAALCSAAKPAGKKSHPAKTPPEGHHLVTTNG